MSLVARLQGKQPPPFRYRDRGSLAVIGRKAAVADLGWLKFAGFPAWLAWLIVHIVHLIQFENKLLVLFQWAWSYFTRKRGARLITGEHPYPLVAKEDRMELEEPPAVEELERQGLNPDLPGPFHQENSPERAPLSVHSRRGD